MVSRNYLFLFLFLLISCGFQGFKDKDFVKVTLVSLRGNSPPITEVEVILNEGEDSILIDLGGQFVVPPSGVEPAFDFVLDFPERFRDQEVKLFFRGLRNGVDILSAETTAVVGSDPRGIFVFVAFCGNQEIDDIRGEVCDDGNTVDGDGCSSLCLSELCGDGVVQVTLGEQCDDGNNIDEDGCDRFCRIEFCGDGKTQEGIGEECDDANDIEGDGCDSNCTLTACGNGIASRGEFCYGPQITFPTGGENTRSVAAGDLNGDGIVDLVTANRDSNNVSVLLNDGSGNFSLLDTFAAGNNPSFIAVADIDADGDQDLIVTNPSTNTVTTLRNDGLGNFSSGQVFSAGGPPAFVTVANFNLDGSPDLAVKSNDAINIFTNNGSGEFSLAFTINISTISLRDSIATGDFDGDGDIDIAVATNFIFFSIFKNNGNAQFNQKLDIETDLAATHVISAVNSDQDGSLDLIVGSPLLGELEVFNNSGAGQFTSVENINLGTLFTGLTAGDFNNDQKEDLALSVNFGIRVLINDNSGNFQIQPTLPTTGTSSLIAEDVNLDGVQDFIFLTGGEIGILFSEP